MKFSSSFVLFLTIFFVVTNCFAMANVKTNLVKVNKNLVELKGKLGGLQDKLENLKYELKYGHMDGGALKYNLEHMMPSSGSVAQVIAGTSDINDYRFWFGKDFGEALFLVKKIKSTAPLVPQPQLQPVANPWQQIVDLFVGNFDMTKEKNPTNRNKYDEMYNAIQRGDFAATQRLLRDEFGSSSKKYGKHNPRTFLSIAQAALDAHQTSKALEPQAQSGMKPGQITATTPVWSLIQNVCDAGGVSKPGLWNPNTRPIRFYFPQNPNIKKPQQYDYYGNYFSNYSNHPVIISGEKFATTEHYFQAQKVLLAVGYKNADYAKILKSTDPDDAKGIAKSYNVIAQDKGWHKQNIKVMQLAIHEKVTQNQDVKNVLLSTGKSPLLEHTVKYDDKIWGIGADGSGRNLLGIILMEERAKISKS